MFWWGLVFSTCVAILVLSTVQLIGHGVNLPPYILFHGILLAGFYFTLLGYLQLHNFRFPLRISPRSSKATSLNLRRAADSITPLHHRPSI